MNKALAIALTAVILSILGACGGSSAEKVQPNDKYDGTFFSVAKPFGADPVRDGSRFVFSGIKFSIVVEPTHFPGATLGNIETSKAFVEAEGETYKSVETSQRAISGLEGIFFTAKESSGTILGWTSSLNGAVVSVKTSQFDASVPELAELFEKTLASFTVTNPDFFMDGKGSSGAETPEATPDDVPGSNKPTFFENDFIKLAIPKNWESSSQSQDSIEITPAIDNTVDANQGISINIMDKHKMASDLAYAKSLVGSARMEKHGKTDYASFSIAAQGIFVYIASVGSKTIMITVSTPSDTLTPRLLEFLGTVELK